MFRFYALFKGEDFGSIAGNEEVAGRSAAGGKVESEVAEGDIVDAQQRIHAHDGGRLRCGRSLYA